MDCQVWQLADHESIVSNELPVDHEGSTGSGDAGQFEELFHELFFPWRGVVVRPKSCGAPDDDENEEDDGSDDAAKKGEYDANEKILHVNLGVNLLAPRPASREEIPDAERGAHEYISTRGTTTSVRFPSQVPRGT